MASALHNAANGLGPVHVSWMGSQAAPPEAAQAAQPPVHGGSRKLLEAVPRAAGPGPVLYLAASGPVAAAQALVMAAWAPKGQPESFAQKVAPAPRAASPAPAVYMAASGPVAAAQALVMAAWAPEGQPESFAQKVAPAPASAKKGKKRKAAAEAPLVRLPHVHHRIELSKGMGSSAAGIACTQCLTKKFFMQGVVQGSVQGAASQQAVAPATSALASMTEVRRFHR